MDDALKYVVLNLKTTMVMLGQEVKVQGCAGYLPVYDSIEQAEQNTDGGKFQITTIKVKE